jgi:hypothetical protein
MLSLFIKIKMQKNFNDEKGARLYMSHLSPSKDMQISSPLFNRQIQLKKFPKPAPMPSQEDTDDQTAGT